MKKLIFALGIILVTSTLNQAVAQCNTEKYIEACIPKLQEGFTFLKSYNIDGEGGAKNKVEYSYVFTKGATYQILICNDGQSTDGIVLTLYDSNRKAVASTKYQGSTLSAIAFPCQVTGIYYITYTFEGSSNYCGGSVLGFKR
ncbi:hypothetical protein GCM10011506_12750 [Marivirga lumbricoides]|uniref:Peptidase C-terminal archaeal/bacterial domain-containing protein n=1 Tax=Marivirga lumbricoides TaxID=1046115 RepID=A0A2T4DVD7_9BACT|nr:hypothetical protein C9994_01240 [Marivirga lumbricoides]GGC28804.1 hypothetical protein GCM10011506_12750 [Marivirga lumbricoides]